MIFNKSKKGEMTIAAIVGWVIGLALLAIILYAVFTGWTPFKQTVEGVSSCSGGGITKGSCVASESECPGVAIQGLGCQDKEPICCATSDLA